MLGVRLGRTLLLGELHCHLLLRGLYCHLLLRDLHRGERGQVGQAEERLVAERLLRGGWLRRGC